MKPWMWIVGALVLVFGCCAGIAGLGFFGARQLISDSKDAEPIAAAFIGKLKTAKDLQDLTAKPAGQNLEVAVSGSCVANAPGTEKLVSLSKMKLGNFSAKSNNGNSRSTVEYFEDFTLGKEKVRILANVTKGNEKWALESVKVECNPAKKDELPDILR